MDEFNDDFEFSPNHSSKLASLFNTSFDTPENSSLIYTAPKQPRSSNNPAELKVESIVLCARVVTLWKLVESKYIQVGTRGLAIIGSQTSKSQELILYKDKTNIIARVKLSKDFKWVLKKDHYSSFSDGENNWLVKFNNEDDLNCVCQQIEKSRGKNTKTPQDNEKTDKDMQDQKKVIEEVKKQEIMPDESPEVKARNDILNRIAKMGQSIFPNQNNFDEPEDPVKIEFIAGEAPVPTPRNNVFTMKHDSTVKKDLQLTKAEPSVVTRDLTPAPALNQNFPIPTSQLVLSQPYDPLSLHFAESRAQNTEFRMSLTQISEKLNQLMQVVDHKPAPVASHDDPHLRKIKVLTLQIENLRRDVKKCQEENEALKQVHRNTEDNKDLKQMIEQLQQDSFIEAEELKNTIKLSDAKISDLLRVIDNQNQQITNVIKEKELLLETQTANEQTLLELQKSVANLHFEMEHSKTQPQPTSDNTKTIDYLKEAMNDMYNDIIASFDDSKEYSSEQIKKIVGKTIKTTTLNVIKNLEQ